ncbi:MAG: aspartyl-tRNA(Asn)/glutamyl-tRNA(Gln) amidotransferase subunit [Actinomycetota bacterium]|jgi:aspartyl-tRNA(Asn)/glutamyl-tRNA(Gln) amidotransferase subunit A|nr:aspartyl-tRNA(Asn)/glutamyl-tRNA(Gln) amidotransferase subunit [Actinomycetota bacterium]
MRSVIEVAGAVRSGSVSAASVVEECLGLIEERDGALNSFLFVDVDGARASAAAVDAAVARGEDPGPLAGVPFGVKDLQDCRGMPTTHGSMMFKDRPVASSDAIQVARLRAAGAIPVGKTTSSEFGAYAFTNTVAWGVTRNPWDVSKTPGGSSGGSAAAVAAGMVPFCTASDGGGSIRIPGAFTGLPGFKPSFGRIPNHKRRGSFTGVWGSMTTTVADCARVLDVCAGPDDRDRSSLPAPGVSYEALIDALDVAGLKAVWSRDFGYAPAVDAEVESLSFAAAERLADVAGLDLVDRPVSFTEPVKVWLGVGTVDIWEDIERGMWPERADEFTPTLQFMYRMTEGVSVRQYARMGLRRQQFEQELAAVYDDVDLVLSPTTAVPAFAAEGPMPSSIGGVALATPALSVPFTMAANLCWNPAISLPCGLTSDGLPVGVQVMARRHRDDIVLRLARLFEEASPWPLLAPGY